MYNCFTEKRNEKGPSLVDRWARRAGIQETFILSWLLWSTQYIIFFFPHRTLFQFMCPHYPATRAGSRAGPPVSVCVSPVQTVH